MSALVEPRCIGRPIATVEAWRPCTFALQKLLGPWSSAAALGTKASGQLSSANTHTHTIPRAEYAFAGCHKNLCVAKPHARRLLLLRRRDLLRVRLRRVCDFGRHARHARFRTPISRWSISVCAAPRVLRVARSVAAPLNPLCDSLPPSSVGTTEPHGGRVAHRTRNVPVWCFWKPRRLTCSTHTPKKHPQAQTSS